MPVHLTNGDQIEARRLILKSNLLEVGGWFGTLHHHENDFELQAESLLCQELLLKRPGEYLSEFISTRCDKF